MVLDVYLKWPNLVGKIVAQLSNVNQSYAIRQQLFLLTAQSLRQTSSAQMERFKENGYASADNGQVSVGTI